MQSYTVERKQDRSVELPFQTSVSSDEHTRDDCIEDSRYHVGFLGRITQLLSWYGIETRG